MAEAVSSVGFKKPDWYLNNTQNKRENQPTLVGERSGKRDAGGTVFLLSDGLINVSLQTCLSGRVSSSDSLPSSTIAMIQINEYQRNTSRKRLYVKRDPLRKVGCVEYVFPHVTVRDHYVTTQRGVMKPGELWCLAPEPPGLGVRLQTPCLGSEGLYTPTFTYYVKQCVLRKGCIYREFRGDAVGVAT